MSEISIRRPPAWSLNMSITQISKFCTPHWQIMTSVTTYTSYSRLPLIFNTLHFRSYNIVQDRYLQLVAYLLKPYKIQFPGTISLFDYVTLIAWNASSTQLDTCMCFCPWIAENTILPSHNFYWSADVKKKIKSLMSMDSCNMVDYFLFLMLPTEFF